MTREGALLVMIGVAAVLLLLGALAWRRRRTRDAGLRAPYGELPTTASVRAAVDGFYVATTRRDEPLERLAIAGMGFRSRATITASDAGVALDLVGQPRIVLTPEIIEGIELATVAIDRVVEPGGLLRLSWLAQRGDGAREAVDTYLRPQEGSARALADTIRTALTPTPPSSTTATGLDV